MTSSGRRLALRLGALSVAAGVAVGFLADLSSAGVCGGATVPNGGRVIVDPVCAGLVRALATRVGVAVAVATVVVVLTAIGLSRLAAWRDSAPDRSRPAR